MNNFWTSLFSLLQPNSLIITANKRLAERIVYESPSKIRSQVIPLEKFILRCFKSYSGDEKLMLLTQQQTYWVWQDIVSEPDNLLHLPTLAETAQSAWNLMKNWQISFEKLIGFYIKDTESFLRYAQAFDSRCQQNQWIDSTSLIEKVIFWLKEDVIRCPKHIILVGFLQPSPLLENLWQTLADNQCRVERFDKKTDNHQTQKIALPDLNTEIITMARYAVWFANNHPNESIHCIIPNLHDIRHDVERIFKAVVSEAGMMPYHKFVNISACLKLTDYPLIKIALMLLRFKMQKLPFQDVTRLLFSPFIADNAAHFSDNALCDAKIREKGNTHYSLGSLIHLLETMMAEESLLLNALKQLASVAVKGKKSLTEWCVQFRDLLSVCGWPGERLQNIDETQIIGRFQKLLNEEFRALSSVIPPISYFDALKLLEKTAGQVLFQPKAEDVYAPIQLLGLLEAIGQPARHIWIMGMNDQAFPAMPKPNPFIPAALQRHYQLPHSNSERERIFSERVLNHLKGQCEKLITSYAEKNQDETQMPSALIRSFENVDVKKLPLCDFVPPAEKQLGISKVSLPREDYGLPVQEKHLSGGTGILKLQSLCPFRAYARHRLQAKKLEQPQTGFEAKERGQLMHSALEYFWRQIKSQQRLLSMDDHQLAEVVNASIQKAFMAFNPKKHLPKTLIQVENLRLNTLMHQWLELEKKRKPFTVSAVERWHQAKIGRLTLKTRIDRIDKVDEGTMLIDYKTGQPDIRSWFGERLEEPQMPIYALTVKQPVCTIAYAQIHADARVFKSVSDVEGILPNNKTFKTLAQAKSKIDDMGENWQNQLEKWKQSLEKLAEDFCKGRAAVDPKNRTKTCRYCEYKTLCRIFFKRHDESQNG